MKVDEATLSQHLPGWDYADSFEVTLPAERRLDAPCVAFNILTPAGPARLLMKIRHVGRQARPTDDGIGPFTVLSSSPDTLVVGRDQRHLDFRLVIEAAAGRARATTLVRRHNRLVRGYFAVVGPFHRRLVPRLLGGAAHRGWPGRCAAHR